MQRGQIPVEIIISSAPKDLKIDSIDIQQGQCFANSYRVAKENANVEIIEGILIFVDINNNGKAMPHAWNKTGDIHFDVTKEKIWENENAQEETKELKYFPICSHNYSFYKNGDIFEFSHETIENVSAITNIIKRNK